MTSLAKLDVLLARDARAFVRYWNEMEEARDQAERVLRDTGRRMVEGREDEEPRQEP